MVYLERNMASKKCPRCKEEKSEEEYYRRSDGINKHQSYCTPCMKAYNKERWAKYKKRGKEIWC